jgi:hypothetical protein
MSRLLTIILIFLLAVQSCTQDGKYPLDVSNAEIAVDAKVIYPKSREWMSPDGGVVPQFNPPSLLWPASKSASYTIRLSQDEGFQKNVISIDSLPYAMYNPHQKLANGSWYWQFKSGGGNWSDLAEFFIDDRATEFVTPTTLELLSKIPQDRPRVYAWVSELAELRERAKGYEETSEILAEAEMLLSIPVINEQEALPKFEGRNDRETRKIAIDASRPVCDRVQYVVSTLSQAYILTGSKKYADAGIRWILEIAHWDPEGATKVTDFGDSGIMHAMAVGYDSFYHSLTKGQKKQLLNAIALRGAHFYDDWVNSLESRLLSNHVWQHILERFFQTALAVKDDLPIADQWLSYIYEIWIARSPVLGHKDGAWSNGISYFRMNTLTMLSITSTLKEITGVDFVKDIWYKNNPEWMIYAWPPHGSADGFGNDAYKLGNPEYERESNDPIFTSYPELNARITQNPYARWYVDKRIEDTGAKYSADKSLKWFFIQRGLRLERPSAPAHFDLPQARAFREVGIAYMNTHLEETSKNLRLAFKSSPYGSYSHTHAEHNCFNLFYGGQPLFSNTGYRPAMGDPHYLADFKNTRGHNGILIDGMGQPFGSESYGWISRFLHGEQISYVVGDATNAYSATDANEIKTKGNPAKNHSDAGLKKFRRHVLMLRPSIIIIYDELETKQPSHFTFLLQNRDMLRMDEAQNVIASNSKAEARTKVFGSQPIDQVLTDEFTEPPVNWRRKTDTEGDLFEYRKHWHYHATNMEKTNKMRFLAVIQIQANEDGLTYNEISIDHKGNQLVVGNWVINAEMNVEEPALISAVRQDGSVAFTSSGPLEIDGAIRKGSKQGSSKLMEKIDGREVLQEVVDELPESIANVLALEKE